MGESKFIEISTLICEPVRAKVLWKLLDGKAYTATELAYSAQVSPTALSNHLRKLLHGGILKVEAQGRHRYYSFANTDVAYVVEALANLAGSENNAKNPMVMPMQGIKYCRSCYDHLAGYAGVAITDAMVQKGYLVPNGKDFLVSNQGWIWLSELGIGESDFVKSRRPLARQCLDWSERRPHLAGHLGAVFLTTVMKNHWFKPVQFSRELIITSKGRQSLFRYLGVELG